MNDILDMVKQRGVPSHTSNRVTDAGALSDESVAIRLGSKTGDPNVITISCSDELGLACDFARLIFEFDLDVVRADLSTDGKWCLMLFWVISRQGPSNPIKWSQLKKRLTTACPAPPSSLIFPFNKHLDPKRNSYLLQTCSTDRGGLMNDLVQALWDLELDVHKVNALTSPDGRAVDVFYLRDCRKFLAVSERQEEICNRIQSVLGASESFCRLSIIPDNEFPESLDLRMFPTLPEELFRDDCNGLGADLLKTAPTMTEFSINIDNSLSPSHTLLQITFVPRRGILYDCTRVLRDFNIRIAYGRLSTNDKGAGDLDLFILQENGNKLVDPDKQNSLSNRLRKDMSDPIRVMIVNRGPDTQLLVAMTVENNGRSRPRILYDITLVLKMLDISIFQVDSEKISYGDRLWEVYRFLLIEKSNSSFRNDRMRNYIMERIRCILVGK
ncbi:hypothetical protein KP509_21G023000 [Ceratopteris richardii]|uniref:ACT domain-containing protein n=1 Tax=Ceratopteris richardii TaxID=49495 RepID=A0A8T2S825_CERRI|nr:hypothetical protein KP509_21G023000 [Ceratopteris richardii]KAH7314835.1 hypothetical protein KP509_21G023000 [Ceratopteris richardii]